ncbi:hypothetical protein [Rhodococcus aetherivorans]
MTAIGSQGDIVDTLVEAHARYPSLDGGSFYDEVLLEVQTRAERDGSIGKADIGALMLWKRLNLNTRWTRELNNLPDREVRKATGAALDRARDCSAAIPIAAGEARRELLKLPGCQHGAAVASAILTAGASDRMAVYDRRAVVALGELGYVDVDARYSRFMTVVCELAKRVNSTKGTGWCPRDVDKALFMLGGQEIKSVDGKE